MKISEHVYFYQDPEKFGSCSNSTIIRGGKQILIDPGNSSPEHLEDLKSAVGKDGLKLEDVQEIWLTHAHPDHAQAVSALVKQYHCKVRCHPLATQVLIAEKPFRELSRMYLEAVRQFEKLSLFLHFLLAQTKLLLKEGKKLSKPVSLLVYFVTPLVKFVGIPARVLLRLSGITRLVASKILEKVFGKWHSILPAKIYEFKESQINKNLPDIQILFLPGHTPEEIGFWDKEEKILIIGDLISGEPKEGPPKKSLILNSPRSELDAGLSSLNRIRKLDPEVLLMGHGRPVIGKKEIEAFLKEVSERTEEIKASIS